MSIGVALLCNDSSWSEDLTTYAAHVANDRLQWPLSGGMPGNVFPCAFWRYNPIETPTRPATVGPRNILILQNRRDNATPWETGRGMRRVLGVRAGFVGADNGGHYVYGTGSACADRATDRFLGLYAAKLGRRVRIRVVC